METLKARPRREKEGFFDTYIWGRGIDIGCGNDPIVVHCERWDLALGNTDATFMEGVPPNTYDWVYSSHLLEHLTDPEAALRRWWGILKPGGYLILYVPHRDLYEKRRLLPSRFNGDHKFFILPEQDDAPHTFSLLGLLKRNMPDARFVYLMPCSEGHTITDPNHHSDGEYSIEAILHKP